jgi:hypothetical protein
MKTLWLLCLLLFTADTSRAQELAVLDFEFFKYEKQVYVVVLMGTTESPKCETSFIVRCVYKSGSWVPGDNMVRVTCETSKEMMQEIRNKKHTVKRGRFITYAKQTVFH